MFWPMIIMSSAIHLEEKKPAHPAIVDRFGASVGRVLKHGKWNEAS
jgi:hypothetical protein